MNISVSIQEKKAFLEWLLSKHNLKLPELKWLLEDIIADEQALECVQFVEAIHDCPKGVKISIGELDEVTFLFFKGKVTSRDVYTAYHELHLYRNERLFFNIDFPEKQWNALYHAVIEVDEDFHREAEENTEAILGQILTEGKISLLEQKINQSLECRDYKSFMKFSKLWKELKDL